MGTATLAARILLALIFATAALAKLRDPSALRVTIRDFGASGPLARLGADLLVPAELAVALGLAFVPTAKEAAIGAVLLLLVFIGGIANALRQGLTPDCGCFGSVRPTPIGRATLIRNVGLLFVAAFATITGPGPSLAGWIASAPAAGLVVGILLVAVTVAALIIQPSVPRVRRTAPRGAVGQSSLALGQVAPQFELDDAESQRRTTQSLLTTGLPLVLVFGSTTCGACVGLFPNLQRWRHTLAERLCLAVIVSGDAAAALVVRQQHGLIDVLADPDREVVRAYGIRASPSAFILTPDGRIANGPAIGSDAIEELIRLTLHRNKPTPTEWTQTTNAA